MARTRAVRSLRSPPARCIGHLSSRWRIIRPSLAQARAKWHTPKPHGISGKSGPLVPRCFEQLHLGQARDHIRHVPVENKHSPTFCHPCHQSWLYDASYPSLRNSPLTTTFLLVFNQDMLFLGLLLPIRICTLQPYFGLPLPSAGASSGRHVCVFSPLSMSCHACSATAAQWSINSWCWLLVRRGRLGCFPPQYQRRTPVERLS